MRAGRSPAELSREFVVTAQSITNWVGQAVIDDGKSLLGKEGLTPSDRSRWSATPLQWLWPDLPVAAIRLQRSLRTCDAKPGRPVRTMYRVLGISASGFYARRERTPSQRRIATAVMNERIRQIRKGSYESYGMQRVRFLGVSSHAESLFSSAPSILGLHTKRMCWKTARIQQRNKGLQVLH